MLSASRCAIVQYPHILGRVAPYPTIFPQCTTRSGKELWTTSMTSMLFPTGRASNPSVNGRIITSLLHCLFLLLVPSVVIEEHNW